MKTALITGSAGGIGARVALDLDQQGCRLLLLDNNKRLNKELASRYQNASCLCLDLTDREALRDFCTEIETQTLDIAFINAGVALPGDVTSLSEELIDLHLDVNLRSAILINKACAKSMAAQGNGHLITTVSLGGITAMKGTAVYSATKFALRGFLSALHSEMKSHGVAVSGIYPSAVDTEMLRNEVRHDGSPLNFVSKVATVDEVASAVQRALQNKKLEVYVSQADALTSRFVAFFPSLLERLYPTLERMGKKGMEQYKKTMRE